MWQKLKKGIIAVLCAVMVLSNITSHIVVRADNADATQKVAPSGGALNISGKASKAQMQEAVDNMLYWVYDKPSVGFGAYAGVSVVDGKLVLFSLQERGAFHWHDDTPSIDDVMSCSKFSSHQPLLRTYDSSSFRELGTLFVDQATIKVTGSADHNKKLSVDKASNQVFMKNIIGQLKAAASGSVTNDKAYLVDAMLSLLMDTVYSNPSKRVETSQDSVVELGYNSAMKENKGGNSTYIAMTYDSNSGSLMIRDSDGTDNDVTAILNWVKGIKINNSNLKWLKYLKEKVSSIKEDADDNQNNDAEDGLEDAVDQDTHNLTAYQRWMNLSMKYFLKGITEETYTYDTDGGRQEVTIKLSDIKSAPAGSSESGSMTELTKEEKARVQTYLKIHEDLSKFKGKGSGLGDTIKDASSIGEFTISEGGTKAEDVKSNADDVIKSYALATPSSNASFDDVIQNIDDLAKYLAAQMYGFKPIDYIESLGTEEVDETRLAYSAFLESIMPSTEVPLFVLLPQHGLPKMSKMDHVSGEVDDYAGYSAYLRLNILLAYTEYYAQNKAGIDESTMMNDSIEKLLTDPDIMANPETANISGYEAVIRSMVSIRDMLDYLGVSQDEMSDKLKKVYDYGGRLLPFENNETMEAYDPTAAKDEPMRNFFYLGNSELSDDYIKGVALSATYIPFQTNTYDIASMACLDDTSWIQRFHYPYGFHRKALYIDTNINAAMDRYITEKRPTDLRVATLKDLLEPEKDVVLYIDDNFYNIDKVAEQQGMYYSRMQNTEAADTDTSDMDLGDKIVNWWEGVTDTDIESIAKTGPVSSYSSNILGKVSQYTSSDVKGEEYVLDPNAIEKYLTGYSEDPTEEVFNEYTPLQSYAVVSAIYRHAGLFNVLSNQTQNPDPVFVSSPTLAAVPGIDREQWNTIYNYMMLKNLESAMGVDYKTTLDLDSPIFMDIYGNIVTSSGLVIIPAMSNATLQAPNSYNVYTAGFMYLYDQGQAVIKEDFNNSDLFMGTYDGNGLSGSTGMFALNTETHEWEVCDQTFDGKRIGFTNLPLNNKDVMSSIMYVAKQNAKRGGLTFRQHVYLITEVLRGAPIENIDFEFEGLKGNDSKDGFGIYIASKLEELTNQLLSVTNGNSMLSLPNPAFMEGVEYVILFLFKIMFAVMVALLMVKIYLDATNGELGIKSMGSFILSCVLFLVVAFSIPKLMDISYYQVNKHLLQDEVEYITLLNLEKEAEGREIGVTDITSYEPETELYLKIDNMDIPWYDILDDVVLNSTIHTVSQAYDEEFNNNLMSSLPGVIKRGNGLYFSISNILDTSKVSYDPENGFIYSRVTETPYASYVTPYYVILDNLIYKVNAYNKANSIESFNTKIMNQGAVKTVGLITPYLTSDLFLAQSEDVSGLKAIYGIETMLQETSPFDADSIHSMYYSLWYDDENLEKMEYYLDELDKSARKFVADNKALLGKVSDESFLKVMALSMAIDYNRLTRVGVADSIEIYDLDARDLIRLSTAKRSVVMQDSSKSFARFVYDNSGSLGVVASAFLVVMYFLSSLIKPACIFIIMASAIAALVVRRLFRKDSRSAIEGFLVTMAVLCGLNLVYGLVLKVSFMIPNLGVTTTMSCVLQILVQGLYLFTLVLFTSYVLQDWQNIGLSKYGNIQANINHAVMTTSTKVEFVNPFVRMDSHYDNQNYKASQYRQSYTGRTRTKGLKGTDILSRMKDNDERRINRRGRK